MHDGWNALASRSLDRGGPQHGVRRRSHAPTGPQRCLDVAGVRGPGAISARGGAPQGVDRRPGCPGAACPRAGSRQARHRACRGRPDRMETEPAPTGSRRPVLLAVRRDQGRVDVDDPACAGCTHKSAGERPTHDTRGGLRLLRPRRHRYRRPAKEPGPPSPNELLHADDSGALGSANCRQRRPGR